MEAGSGLFAIAEDGTECMSAPVGLDHDQGWTLSAGLDTIFLISKKLMLSEA
jgi:hypothetical protein